MKTQRILIWALCCAWAFPVLALAASLSPEATAKVQQTWKLLDYVATDYVGAVKGGVVTVPSEYAEQQEFAGHVVTLLAQLPATLAQPALQQQAVALVAAIDAKAAPEVVAQRSHALATALLAAYPIPTTPTQAPNLAQGAALYQQQCAACHGATGDGHGPAGAMLDPPPIAFTDAERADLRSPLSLYQAISQGIQGTAMQGYGDTLSDAQRWSLAYYTGSLAYAGDAAKGATAWQGQAAVRAKVSSLAELSQTRAEQLAPALGLPTARALLGWLRAHPEAVAQAPHGMALARARLAASLAAYQAGRAGEAVPLALSAYLDGVEPEEPRLDARNHGLRTQIETAMGAYRTTLSRRQPIEQARARAAEADALLAEAQELLEGAHAGPATAFVGAYTILVREGLEALLVVVALLAFLRKSEKHALARHVHLGWVLALLAGGITWALARYAIAISGASRELTEGLSSLFAAAVLLSVGLWMHQKSIGGRWQSYLKQQMNAALQRRSAWFLFALAFISVYREVFEAILFYAALWSDGQHGWMLLGMLAAVATLAVVAWLLLRTSRRLPLSQFFLASSALIALLAFVLAGKGVAALQEAGWIGVSMAPIPRIEWLGIYPTWQSVLMQLLVVLLLAAGFGWNVWHGRRTAALATRDDAHA